MTEQGWEKEVKFMARCFTEKMGMDVESLARMVGVCQVWVLGGGLDPGRDYVFHYPNISNFSLNFEKQNNFGPPHSI